MQEENLSAGGNIIIVSYLNGGGKHFFSKLPTSVHGEHVIIVTCHGVGETHYYCNLP